jgi:hypothetical protein
VFKRVVESGSLKELYIPKRNLKAVKRITKGKKKKKEKKRKVITWVLEDPLCAMRESNSSLFSLHNSLYDVFDPSTLDMPNIIFFLSFHTGKILPLSLSLSLSLSLYSLMFL